MLKFCKLVTFFAAMCAVQAAQAEIRISDDWPQNHLSMHEQLHLLLEKDELKRIHNEADAMTLARNARTEAHLSKSDPSFSIEAHYDRSFMLFVDGVKYYMRGAMFMSKTRPDEKCTPVGDVLDYRCEQGQRYKESGHLLFMDSNFHDAGVYKIKIDTPYDVFVNAMPALGVANKVRNELLVTVQYFAIDSKGAHSISEVGEGWKRMTVLLRLKAVGGKIQVEQDDSCLGNPNNFETIPDARKTVKQCED